MRGIRAERELCGRARAGEHLPSSSVCLRACLALHACCMNKDAHVYEWRTRVHERPRESERASAVCMRERECKSARARASVPRVYKSALPTLVRRVCARTRPPEPDSKLGDSHRPVALADFAS
eukprot:2960328-Pleurochrysis_carterae.AAC.3